MRIELLLLSVALVGCANVSPPAPQINEDCLSVAKFARAATHLREIGVPRDQISQYTSTPKILTFPLQAVQDDVYRRTDGGEIMAQEYYDLCVASGFQNLLGALQTKKQHQLEQDQKADHDSAMHPLTLKISSQMGKPAVRQHTP